MSQDPERPWNHPQMPFDVVSKQIQAQLEKELDERTSHCHPVVKMGERQVTYKGDMEYWMVRTTKEAPLRQTVGVVSKHLLETFYRLHDMNELDAIGDQVGAAQPIRGNHPKGTRANRPGPCARHGSVV